MTPMPRRLEPLPQRRLVLELKAAIDTAIRDEGWSRSLRQDVARGARMRRTENGARVLDLIDAHPHGFRTKHVQRQLGMMRRHWVLRFLREQARFETDA